MLKEHMKIEVTQYLLDQWQEVDEALDRIEKLLAKENEDV